MKSDPDEPPEGGGEAVPDPQVEVPDQQPEQRKPDQQPEPAPDGEQVPQQPEQPWLTWETPPNEDPPPDAKPKARQKKVKLPTPKGAIRNWRDLRALPEREFALPILPKRGVVMASGPKSSGKMFTTDCLMGMVAYGVPWCDGTKTRRSLAFIVTTEDKPEWDRKHSAWLTLMGFPIIDQDNVKFVEPADELFHREAETKRGKVKVKVEQLDLLDPASVDILIKQCQQTMKAEKLGCGILALDNLASLVPGRLDKPEIQLLVRHLHLIANKLNCCVILINHVHLKNPRQYQGVAALGDLIDGTFYVSRVGTKTHVFIERLKGGVADGMTLRVCRHRGHVGIQEERQAHHVAGDASGGSRRQRCRSHRPRRRYPQDDLREDQA